MKLASRLGNVGESETMRVTRRVAELRAEGRDILGFGAGEPDFPSPPSVVEAAREALAAGFTRYTPAAGTTDLRQALLDRYADRWGSPWNELEQIVITVGANETDRGCGVDGDHVGDVTFFSSRGPVDPDARQVVSPRSTAIALANSESSSPRSRS